jgi:hypothetical protein
MAAAGAPASARWRCGRDNTLHGRCLGSRDCKEGRELRDGANGECGRAASTREKERGRPFIERGG